MLLDYASFYGSPASQQSSDSVLTLIARVIFVLSLLSRAAGSVPLTPKSPE